MLSMFGSLVSSSNTVPIFNYMMLLQTESFRLNLRSFGPVRFDVGDFCLRMKKVVVRKLKK